VTAYLRALEYHVPQTARSNDDLVRLNPTWDSKAIYAKTGICARPIAAAEETAADLGCCAAEKLFAATGLRRGAVDALVFCTQSPDYFLPTTACMLQTRLGLPCSCAAFDINLGCSGFTYGLWLAGALVRSQSAGNILLIVGDTYSKYCNPHDLATATIFADGAAAALITASPQDTLAAIGPSVLGTDGRGAENLIVRAGAARHRAAPGTPQPRPEDNQNQRSEDHLFMNGPEIYTFTLSRVHSAIAELLEKVALGWGEIDLFLLHQANRFMLEQLRRKMNIPPEKMPIDVEDLGNTVSASLPILVQRCQARGILKPGHKCVLAGFGVGYSWAMTFLQWQSNCPSTTPPTHE